MVQVRESTHSCSLSLSVMVVEVFAHKQHLE